MRGLLSVGLSTVLIAAGIGSSGGQAEELDLSHVELLLSRGTTANVVTVDAGLAGIPSSRQDVKASLVFPLEANTVVLGFPDTAFKYDGVNREVVLTEDGLWGLAAPLSANQRPYFLNEKEIRQIVNDLNTSGRTWYVVTSNFSALNGAIGFSRGEVFPFDGVTYGVSSAIFDRDDPLTGAKYNDIANVAARQGALEGVIVEPNRFAVRLTGEQGDHVESVDARKLIDFLAELDERRNNPKKWNWNPFGNSKEIDPIFKEWTKSIWLNEPFRVDCTDEVSEKNKSFSEFTGKLDAKFGVPEFLSALGKLGLTLEGGISATKSWTSDADRVSTIKDTSFDVDTFLLGTNEQPTVFSFGRASTCAGDAPAADYVPRKFFIATVPGIAGSAVDIVSMQDMGALDPATIKWNTKSGLIETGCLAGGYRKVLDYLESLGIERPIARLIASRMVKVSTAHFLDC